MASHFEISLVSRLPQELAAPTMNEQHGLSWSTFTVREEVSASGSLDVSLDVGTVPSEFYDRLKDPMQFPSELWLRRDGVVKWAGPLVGARVRRRELTLSANGLLYYLWFMSLEEDYSDEIDQALHVKAVVDVYQALAYGNFGLVTSAITAHGVVRPLDIPSAEAPKLGSVIQDFGARDDGYDVRVEYGSRELVLDHPRTGSDLTSTIVLDQRVLHDTGVSWMASEDMVATELYGTAHDSGLAFAEATATNPTLRAQFGRVRQSRSYTTLEDEVQLQDRLDRDMDTLSRPSLDIEPGAHYAVEGVSAEEFGPGDTVEYSQDVGLGVQTENRRIKAREYSVSAPGVQEDVRVEFEDVAA